MSGHEMSHVSDEPRDTSCAAVSRDLRPSIGLFLLVLQIVFASQVVLLKQAIESRRADFHDHGAQYAAEP